MLFHNMCGIQRLSVKKVFYLIVMFFVHQHIQAQVNKADSLLRLLEEETTTPKHRVDLLNKLGQYYAESRSVEAYKYIKQAIKEAQGIECSGGEGIANLHYGVYLLNNSEIDSAKNVLIKALELISENEFGYEKASAYNELGICYESLGNYKLALTNYYYALRGFEIVNNQRGRANAYNNIGLIYYYQKKFNTSETFLEKSLAIAEENNYEAGVANACSNLGMNCIELKEYEKGLRHYEKVLKIDLASGDDRNIAGTYDNIGIINVKLGNIQKALSSFEKSEKHYIRAGYKIGLSNNYVNYADAYVTIGKTDKAQYYLDKAIDIVSRYNYINNRQEIANIRYRISEQRGNYKSALQDYKHFIEIRDSIIKSDNEELFSRIQTEYEVDKTEQESKLKDTLIQQARKVKAFYLVLIILITIICIALALYLLSRIKFSRELEQKRVEIERQNAQLRLQYIELEKARQEAEAASTAKSQFLSVMSHEIRTPLNAIVGISNLIGEAEKVINDESIKVLKTASTNLLSLVNDILDLSKLESGKLQLETIDFDLRELLKNLQQVFMVPAIEKQLVLDLDMEKNISSLYKGDPLRLNQVMTNLVSNAIKFTTHGSVKIGVQLISQTRNTNTLKFSVTDTGIGVAQEKQEKIFESFTQADSATTRKYGGTGLGLSISKRILNMLGSDLQLKSKEGAGAHFYFVLTLQKNNQNKLVNNNQETINMDVLKGKKVLVAEDNPMNVYVMKQFMNKWGLELDIANNGAEAIEKLNMGKQYDIVLMDLHMPVMDGMEASKEIRANSSYGSVPIIAITATAETETRAAIDSCGMNDFVMKPFQPNELIEKMIKYLS